MAEGENFLIAPTSAKASTTLAGLSDAVIAQQILSLIAKLPAKTPGVAEIKKGAIALAQAGGAKLAKTK